MSEKKEPRRLKAPYAGAARAAIATVEPEEPITAAKMTRDNDALWLKIRTEYITDPAGPTCEMLARKYGRSLNQVLAKCADGGWVAEREAWWTAAEVKLLEKIQDEYLKERVHEMKILRRSFDALSEVALPLVDKDGKVLRGEDGMPRFALPFKSQEQVIRSMLLVQERSMLLRGEAIMRTESAIKDKRAEDAAEEDPTFAALAGKVNFSPAELRALARQFLVKREAALASVNDDTAIDADAEENDDGGSL